jgi:hypothetical protein
VNAWFECVKPTFECINESAFSKILSDLCRTMTSSCVNSPQIYFKSCMQKYFFFIFAIFLGVQCKNSTKTTEPLQIFDAYVQVLEQEGQVRTQATLRSMGKADAPTNEMLPVEAPGGIRYQGTPMKVRPTVGLSYTLDFPGKYQPIHQFSWGEQQDFSVTAQMVNTPDFGFGSDKIKYGQPVTCTWKGDPLERGETLILMWENLRTHAAVPIELYAATSQPSVSLPAAKVKDIVPGEWSVYLVRKRLNKGQVKNVQTQVVCEFYSKPDTLMVTK